MIKFVMHFIEAVREVSHRNIEETHIMWAVHRKAVAL